MGNRDSTSVIPWFVSLFTGLIVVAIGFAVVENIKFPDGSSDDLKGDISGSEYIIDIFDGYGAKTLETGGSRIGIDSNIVEAQVYTSGEGWQLEKTVSSVLTVTVDGRQLVTCGDTCIFYDKRLSPEYMPETNGMESSPPEAASAAADRGMMNRLADNFEKSTVVIIKSQTGIPVYAFSGDSVSWEVARDLPEFTKLTIDGMALYIHRANFQIVDRVLLEKTPAHDDIQGGG